MSFSCLDERVPEDHRVRLVWSFVERLDISPLLARLKTFKGVRGGPATDPRILLALWLFATLDGVGSAREIDRLCERDDVYRWIAGGVGVNYHTLADFRASAGPFLDEVLTKSVAALVQAGIADLSCVAVDSLRVKASAGSASFRRRPSLAHLEALARQRVEQLKAEPGVETARRRKAQERAARERADRLEAALEAVAQIEAARAAEDKAKRRKTPKPRNAPRASTTDPAARVMKLGDGAFRPGYNLQIKTDPTAAVVVGVSVGTNASDRGLLEAAAAEIQRRHGRRPKVLLADDGYDARKDIEAVEGGGTAVHVPLPKKAADAQIRPGDTSGVREWKTRMATDEGKAVYARRINTEHTHAQMRNHGLLQMPVRGVDKVMAVALLFAVATNLLLHGPKLLLAL
ncbi:MAG TPA: transposase [Caulobacteraceae bacterium]|jgi:transposase